jgi:hypothetical protein
LFTVQVALIRKARADIHRRLGLAGAALAAIMVVLGPATALVVDAPLPIKANQRQSRTGPS